MKDQEKTKEDIDKEDKIRLFNESRLEKLVFAAKAISEKYVYYLLAIDAACVGFSINQSKNLSLTFYHIPLALSIVFWSLSFWYGLNQISKFERQIDLNIIQLKSIIIGAPLSNKDNVELYNIQGKIANDRKRQNLCFAIGVVFFIAWHILNMYLNR
jgi:hypothetical protein